MCSSGVAWSMNSAMGPAKKKNKNTETSLHKHAQKSLLDAKQTHQNYGR